MKIAMRLLALLVTVPIWYYLLYQILVRVEASELMWFLYWVYLPTAFLVNAVRELTEKDL